MNKLTSLVILGLFFVQLAYAQQPTLLKKEVLGFVKASSSPQMIRFKSTAKISPQQIFTTHKEAFGFGDDFTFKLTKSWIGNLGMQHDAYHLYYKEVRVESGEFIVHSKDNRVRILNGNPNIPYRLNAKPSISKQAALNHALGQFSYEEVSWIKQPKKDAFGNTAAQQHPLPAPELIFFEDDANLFHLAWKTEVWTTEKQNSMIIYTDAMTGKLLFDFPLALHGPDDATSSATTNKANTATCGGGCPQNPTTCFNESYTAPEVNLVCTQHTALTEYNGEEYIVTTENTTTGRYELSDNCRNVNAVIYDAGVSYPISSLEIEDFADPSKGLATYVQGYWATEMAVDYLQNAFNRNSYDDLGSSITVRFYTSGCGPSWSPGIVKLRPFCNTTPYVNTIDVIGHEVGHGIANGCSGGANTYESSAISEGFSDIFGTALEFYAEDGCGDYQLANDVAPCGRIRNLADPNATKGPDTYGGDCWNNSYHQDGLLFGYWFYLLNEGDAGYNDNGDAFNVDAIGIDKAMQIAYRGYTIYQPSSGGYECLRDATVQAAIDLYGSCSSETTQVLNAWDAVGVYDPNINVNVHLCDDYNSTLPTFFAPNLLELDGLCNPGDLSIASSGADITFEAGRKIVFGEGFRAELGSNVHASIVPCATSGYPDDSQPCNCDPLTDQHANYNTKVLENTLVAAQPLVLSSKVQPNPFSKTTEITYSLPQSATINLTVYTIAGKVVNTLVSNELQVEGEHNYTLNASDLIPGLYYYVLSTENTSITKKLVLTK